MKKSLQVLLVSLVSILVLTGCGKSIQKEYTDGLKSLAAEEKQAGKFDFSFKKLELADTTASQENIYMHAIITQLKDVTFEGNYAVDQTKKNAVELDLKLKALGIELPVEVVGNDEDIYMSTSFISGMYSLATSLSGTATSSAADFDELEGKYISIQNTEDLLGTSGTTSSSSTDEKSLKNMTAFTKEYQKKVYVYIESLDKAEFTKKEDTISHTFTKKELNKILSIYNEVAKSKKKYKDLILEEDTLNSLKEFKKLNMTVAIDPETKKTTIDMNMAPKDTASGLKSLSFQLNMSVTKFKSTPEMPAKSDIIDEDQLKEIMDTASSVTSGTTTSTNDSITDTDYTFTDSDFTYLKEALSSYAGQLTADQVDQVIGEYKSMLTQAQYSELKTMLIGQ